MSDNEDPLSNLGELTFGLLNGSYELVSSERISDSNEPGYTDCEYRFICKSKDSHSKTRAQ